MKPLDFTIQAEQPNHFAAIDALNEEAFGPGRFARAAYRLREGIPHDPGLSFVALVGGAVIASVRLTEIRIGDAAALLLGPLAVLPACKGRGAGRALVRTAVDAARAAGHKAVILVGDEPYYGPLGFRPVPPGQVVMPGPVDPARLLIAELAEGAAAACVGPARPAPQDPT